MSFTFEPLAKVMSAQLSTVKFLFSSLTLMSNFSVCGEKL